MKQLISGIVVLSLFSALSCSLSENAKRLIISTSIGCTAGLIVGAVFDESQRKKDSKDKKNNFQRQITDTLKQEKKKPQNKGKIIGLSAGCLAGLGTGYYLNTMHENMSEQMSKDGIQVEKVSSKAGGETDAVLVKMDGGIAFEDGKADLKGKGKEGLDKLSETLAAYPETKVNITGHANKTGAEDKNLQISQSRADAVKSAILENGTEAKRIGEVKGVGSSSPSAGLKPEDGANRRVEIEIVPAT